MKKSIAYLVLFAFSFPYLHAQVGFEVNANGINFKMIKVNGGAFNQGCNDEEAFYDWEKGAHKVTLSSYYIGETEVTQALWQAVMGSNPSTIKNDNFPMIDVSWNEIQTFIGKLNSMTGYEFRLPTEAEWEFAARGGQKGNRQSYSGSNNIDEVGWYSGNSMDKPHEVKQKKPNGLGLYDMTGNVWEFCSDWFGDFDTAPKTNPQGPIEGGLRVLKGGSWFVDAGMNNLNRRFFDAPDHKSPCNGFRLVL